MNRVVVSKLDEMINSLEHWLYVHDCKYMECNYVPAHMFTRNRKLNLILRSIYRLSPVNFRGSIDGNLVPITPHSNVALLKAFTVKGDDDLTRTIFNRVLDNLRSSKTKNFSLRQGIKIAVNLYEDSEDDPTPLNTVWFGEFLLDTDIIDEDKKKSIILSICSYLVEELGYKDYDENGIYFYYGHNLNGIIYNASAIISSFLLKCGIKYDIPQYIELAKKGIAFIVNNQNSDGSWFYYGPPLKKAIDGFHQCYVLKALIEASHLMSNNYNTVIGKGIEYYRTMFIENGSYLIPKRYDKRFNPKNTWLFQKIDGRDLSEAIIFFSKYDRDESRVEKLISYMYDHLYIRKKGRFAPEIFVYGVNRNDYIEFYAWYLYALYIAKNEFA